MRNGSLLRIPSRSPRPPRGRCLRYLRTLRTVSPPLAPSVLQVRGSAPAHTLFSAKSLPGRVFRYANRVRPDHPPVATLQLSSPPHSHRGLAARRRRQGPQVSPASRQAPASSLCSSTHAPAGPGRGRSGAATSRGAEREWGRGPLCAASRGRCPGWQLAAPSSGQQGGGVQQASASPAPGRAAQGSAPRAASS